MKNLILLSFCFLFTSVQAQYANMLRVTDNLTNAGLWSFNNAGNGGIINIPTAGSLGFTGSCDNGFGARHIPNFSLPGVSPVQAPNIEWTLEFRYTPTLYSTNGTAHLIMSMTNKININPVQDKPLAGYITTDSDVIGVMLSSPPGATPELGIWVKDGNQAGNNVVYASSSSGGGGGISNTFTTTTTAVGAVSNNGTIPYITNGIKVPVGASYQISLKRTQKNITLNVINSNGTTSTTIMELPLGIVPNVSPSTGPNYACANIVQAGTVPLNARIQGIKLSWPINNFLTQVAVGGISATTLTNSNGVVMGYGYCGTIFNNMALSISVSTPTFGGNSSYNWTINQCLPTPYTTQATSPNVVKFSGSLSVPAPATSCISNSNGTLWDFPHKVNITNLPINTPGNAFDITGYGFIRINPACRLANPNLTQNTNEPFQAYPNPTKDHITLSGVANFGIIHTAEIFNMNGQSVQKESIESEKTDIELNVSALPQGIYILKVDTENGQQVQKFVKE